MKPGYKALNLHRSIVSVHLVFLPVNRAKSWGKTIKQTKELCFKKKERF